MHANDVMLLRPLLMYTCTDTYAYSYVSCILHHNVNAIIRKKK